MEKDGENGSVITNLFVFKKQRSGQRKKATHPGDGRTVRNVLLFFGFGKSMDKQGFWGSLPQR